MERWKEGDQSKGICQACGVKDLTFKLRDIPYPESGLILLNILCGVCNHCGAVISIPQQSVADIHKQINKLNL